MMDSSEWEYAYREDSSQCPDVVKSMRQQGWQVVGSLRKGWVFKRKLEVQK